MYLNYIGKLNPNEYLKFTCENKGICCTLNHIYKVRSSNEDIKDKISVEYIKPIDDIKVRSNIVEF